MTPKPKISVIVPMYKVENYIEKCARSLFEQTLDSVEYIFVDDCGGDRSVEVLERVVEQYPQRKESVRIIRHSQNRGSASARNTALDAAQGEFIAACDADDWVDSTMYEKLYAKALEEGSDVVVCDHYKVVAEGKMKHKHDKAHQEPLKYLRIQLRQKTPWFMLNRIMRREVIERIALRGEEGASNGDDYYFTNTLLLHCGRVSKVDEPLYFYNCTNANSISASFSVEKTNQLLHNIAAFEQQCRKRGLFDEFEGEIIFNRLRAKRWLLKSGDKQHRALWHSMCPESHSLRALFKSHRLHLGKKIRYYLVSKNII